MCGRFSLTLAWSDLAALYRIGDRSIPRNLAPRYNIAPTQGVTAVRTDPVSGQRELVELRWGLVPSRARDTSVGARMINARAETVAEKPALHQALARRRCLIPADGFYEWQARATGPKRPFLVAMSDASPFAFAGLWERWDRSADGKPVESCTIITTTANDLVRPIHDRMPVILAAEHHEAWLDVAGRPPEAVVGLLTPFPADRMAARPVSTYVNTVAHDDARCFEPADDADTDLFGT